jgi:protein-disulfide isomerase
MNHARDSGDHEAALAAEDHVLGDTDTGAHASLTLVEYGDYECPACSQAAPLIQRWVESSGKRLRFIYRHFPLMETHPHAELAAEAAEAAAAQGEFWAMHHLLVSQPKPLDLPALTAHAQSIGLDMNRFNGEMADRIYTQRIQEHRRAGERRGVHATPSFFLDGAPVDVSFGFDKLNEVIHAALDAASPESVKHPRSTGER